MLLKKIPLNKQFYLKSEDLYCKLIKKGEACISTLLWRFT